ncbi:MAG: ATP-binding protein [Panacagrimonas sp.]
MQRFERADSDRAVTERERRLNLALRVSRLHVWTFDVDAHRLAVAEALCSVVGVDRTRCRRPGAWRSRIHPDDHVRVERAFRECLEQGQDLDVEFRITLANGMIGWLSLWATLVADEPAGRHLHGVCADITDRRAEEQRLREGERHALELAEAAARARDQFLAIVSHELRSPLNGIQNWANVLEGQMPTDASSLSRRAVAGIKHGVDQQVRLIEDLLDATRIMSGNLSLALDVIEIRPVVEAAIASVIAVAATRKIEIQRDLHLNSEQVRADPDRLQQIIWNLLSNALKFTPPGGHVRVSLDRAGSMVRLRVTDNGKGIAPEFLPHMFDWFRRDETSSQRGQDGLGLGLTLVRHLCELHGGHVSAASPGPGLGASFEVRLPLLVRTLDSKALRAANATQPHPFPSLKGLRVLLIEDQRDALDALSALLSSMQARVWAFISGGEAMAWLEQQAEPGSVDVVVCDIAMPVEDGYATLARIRALENQRGLPANQRLPVIALTAFTQREDRQRALDAGFAMHLAKPVSAEDLAAAITSVASSGM